MGAIDGGSAFVTIRSDPTSDAGAGVDPDGGLVVADPAGAVATVDESVQADAGRDDVAAAADADASSGSDRERWIQRVILALSLAPLVLAAIQLVFGVGGSYMPVSDHALTELQIRDVGRHEVLVGLYSRADWSHPGPALFYLMAPFYWVTGGASIGMNLGALAINGAAVAGMLAVARRHGGIPLMATTAVGCALLLRATGAEFAHDPWNCYITTLPFGLAIMLTWSMLCGWRWALPLGVGVASCVAQVHVGFVALALPLAAAGAVGLGVRAWRSTPARAEGLADRVRRTGLVAPTLATIGVLAVVWAPMVADVLLNAPSNIRKIITWFGEGEGGTQSVGSGVRTVIGQFGVDAEWLGGKATQSIGGESPFLHSAPTPWLLVPVVVAAVALWRWRGAGRWLVATLAATLALSVLAIVRTVGPAVDYRLRWTWMVAVLVAAATVWAGLRAATHRSETLGRVLLGVLGVVLVAVSAVNMVTGATAGTPGEGDSDAMAALMPAVLEEVEGVDGTVLVTDGFSTGTWYGRGIVLQLERAGIDARVPRNQRQLFGDRRVDDGGAEVTLMVATNEFVEVVAADPGMRLVVEWTDLTPEERADAEAEWEQIDEDLAAGRITPEDHAFVTWAVDMKLAAETEAVHYRVAVFVRETEAADAATQP